MKSRALPILGVILVAIIVLVGLQTVLGELSRSSGSAGEQPILKPPSDNDDGGGFPSSVRRNGSSEEGVTVNNLDGGGNGEDGLAQAVSISPSPT